jgi:hypothetical protein
MVLWEQFFPWYHDYWSLPECPTRRISSISSSDGCEFQRNILQQYKSWPHAMTQCWMSSVLIFISYWAFWKTRFTETIRAQSSETRYFSRSNQHQRRNSSRSFAEFLMPAENGHGCQWVHVLKMCFMWLLVLPRLLNSIFSM